MRFLGIEVVGKDTPSQRSVNIFDESFWESKEMAGQMSSSGARVNKINAIQVAAVYACVRVLSETIASVPCILYRRDPNGKNKERATEHPLYNILQNTPNDWMTRFEWMECMMRACSLGGNAFSRVLIKGTRPTALIPLCPEKMTLKWLTYGDEKTVIYEYRDDGKTIQLAPWEVVHFRGPSDDGGIGKGPLQEAREGIGNALTLDNYQNNLYNNGVRLSGILEHPQVLTDESSDRIARSFAKAYAGAKNSGKVAVLEEGMKFNSTSITPKDAEYIAVKNFSVREIARIFRVPPHMIGDLNNATFSNIEQESISFVVNTIRPWAIRFEQALMRTLLTEEEQKNYYVEFLLDALLRGDTKTRYDAYQVGLQNGFMTVNEVREKENMNSLDWGDASMIPLNMRPVQSKEDLNPPPVDAPPPVAKDVPAKKSLDLDPEVLERTLRARITESFEPLMARALSTCAKREMSIGEQLLVAKNRTEFDTAVRAGFKTHSNFVRSHMEPVIKAYAEQLQLIGASFYVYKDTQRADEDFIIRYVEQYVDGQFDEVWRLGGDADAINAWQESVRRNLHQGKVKPLLESISQHVFQEGESHATTTN